VKLRYGLTILILFSGLAWSAHCVNYFPWDLQIAVWLQSWTRPGFQTFMRCISVPGNGLWRPYILETGACLALLVAGKRLEAACGAMSAGGGGLLGSLFKWMVARPRPSAELIKVWTVLSTPSFPSGHVVHYVTFYGFYGWVMSRHIANPLMRTIARVVSSGLVLLVGPSRIYLGTHWASDVLGGYLLGGMWLWLSIWVYQRYKNRSRRN